MNLRQSLLSFVAVLYVSAVPLNINLGAYSPALVVGDGEISFGGSPERASEILQTLSTGAQNGAVPSGQIAAAPATAPAEAAAQPARQGEGIQSVAAAAASAISTSTAIAKPEVVDPPLTSTAVDGVDTALNAVPISAAGETGQMPAEYISHAVTTTTFPNTVKEKRYLLVDSSTEAPDAATSKERRDAAIAQKVKRDIDGFKAALQFARDAQLTQPRIELGLGITQNAGANVPVNSAANGALPPGQSSQAKRSESEIEDTLGMTLIAISEI